MAARTSRIDESADDGVPAEFWENFLEDTIMDDMNEMPTEEQTKKKKEEDLEKVRKFNEAWNIAPPVEETRVVVMERQPDPTPEPESKSLPEPETKTLPGDEPHTVERSVSPDDCTLVSEVRETIALDDEPVPENSVVVIPSEGQAKDPRLKRLEDSSVQSPSSPTQESRNLESSQGPRYFQRDTDRDREEQLRREREDFERARSRLRGRSPQVVSDEDDDDSRHRFGRARSRSRYGRSNSRTRSRSPRRGRSSRRSRSRSRDRNSHSRRNSRSRSGSRARRSFADEMRDKLSNATGNSDAPASVMSQMSAMMQMMMDPKNMNMMNMMNPMMAMMMNPMMAAATAAASNASKSTGSGTNDQQDKKDDITAQLFVDGKINLSDYLASKNHHDGKKSSRVSSKVVQRIKEAIGILDKQETKLQSAKFLYVAPTYHSDLKKLDNRSPLIWNDQNVLYAMSSKSKDVVLCEPFRNVNQKMKQMIDRLGLDEGNVSQRIAQRKREFEANQSVADVGTIQAITIVPVRGGAATKRIIDRSIQTEDLGCFECVQRRNKTYVSATTQTQTRARTAEISVQTDRDRNVEMNSMSDLNANQVKIINEIMKYMKRRQVSGSITNLMHNLERDAPELRNQHLNAGLHYVSEIHERNERNATRYAGPNPFSANSRGSRDPRQAKSFEDSHRGVDFDAINQVTSLMPAGFRKSPDRQPNRGYRRQW
ncbi:uncharacterized protein LOC129752940 [Uranotaenia lowii]|uniref:uncharacterized protein LOC129752940 n=1 Tax=Uranotaenia lowii TaxID=190385 RepID=UPI0024789C1C|nr:uncharacterized protein LOC129752940 [Uranotaenia lowii]